jgi:hypothetical protein
VRNLPIHRRKFPSPFIQTYENPSFCPPNPPDATRIPIVVFSHDHLETVIYAHTYSHLPTIMKTMTMIILNIANQYSISP